MSKKTIMLICSSGMSTSLLVSKMEKAAEGKDFDIEIFAVSTSEADSYLENKTIDAILLGPQVKYIKPQLEKKVEGKGIYLDVINFQDYGMMNGKKVLETTLENI